MIVIILGILALLKGAFLVGLASLVALFVRLGAKALGQEPPARWIRWGIGLGLVLGVIAAFPEWFPWNPGKEPTRSKAEAFGFGVDLVLVYLSLALLSLVTLLAFFDREKAPPPLPPRL